MERATHTALVTSEGTAIAMFQRNHKIVMNRRKTNLTVGATVMATFCANEATAKGQYSHMLSTPRNE